MSDHESEVTSAPQGLTPWAYGEAVFNERRLVEDLIEKEVFPRLQGRPFSAPSEKLFFELFQRVRYWVGTLGRLATAGDFQAVVGCDRALFEMTTDLTLLRFRFFTPEKMLAWDASAKLKAARAAVGYFTERRLPIPQHFQPYARFISTCEAQVLAMRATHFRPDRRGKVRHPPRWTDSTLADDARDAQKATPSRLSWAMDLEEFYATRYQRLCWNVHGSSVVAIRFIPGDDVPFLGAEALCDCLDFAVRSTQLVLMEFGLYGTEAQAAFEKCVLHRKAMRITVLRHHDPALGSSTSASGIPTST